MRESVSATVITDDAALDQLDPAWRELYARCPDATPFQSPAWLLPWWRTFGTGLPFVIAIARGETLVAVAPLFVQTDVHGLRRLRLIGTGITDYPDILAPEEESALCGDAFWRTIERLRASWDVCDFSDLRENSPLFKHPLPSKLIIRIQPCAVAPLLPLPKRIELFHNSLPSSLRRNLRRHRARLAERGTIQLGPAETSGIDVALEALFQLHTSQWRHRGHTGAFARPQVRLFHRRVASELGLNGTLKLWTMRCGEEIIGAKYTLWRDKRAWSYLSGIDVAYLQFSPGALMFESVIDYAIITGCTEFDFLRGAEPYKYLWGARDRRLYRLTGRAAESSVVDDPSHSQLLQS